MDFPFVYLLQVLHFFSVALHAMGKAVLPFPTPHSLRQVRWMGNG